MELSEIYAAYGNPDPSIVSWVAKNNGPELAYVGHGEVTRILCEIDPFWTWEPLGVENGRPVVHIHNGFIPRRNADAIPVSMTTMWGTLTLNGVSRLAVGSVEAHKPDRDKELVSDLLRNGAMRFGVALGLWIKDNDQTPSKATQSPAEPRNSHPSDQAPDGITDGQQKMIYAICKSLDRLPPPGFRDLSKREAMQLIDQLKQEQAAKAAATEEPR
ncbi:hypothetical protein UFOVP227_30 [uncultured Caudovirales phage]|uniref:Uncharacterized protein n=1 Tax=uncultured Caudovirales phage TaxID=2100421 RepID=A0A6J7WLY9_9CAUD|nr:hypothetical protein UFOVP227_30 [uncultured Caudovirales phage]